MTRVCASVEEARGSFSRGFLDAGSPASLDNPGDYATFNSYQPSDGTHGEPERLGGLEVGHIVVNGLTEQAPDVL